MSIRHVDDLRKIKPVITFMIDHFDEVGKDIVPSTQPIVAALPEGRCRSSTAGYPTGSSLSVSLPNPLFGEICNGGIVGAVDAPMQSRMPALMGATMSQIQISPEGIDSDQFPSKHPRFDNVHTGQRMNTASSTGLNFQLNVNEEYPFSVSRDYSLLFFASSVYLYVPDAEVGARGSFGPSQGLPHCQKASEEWKILQILIDHKVLHFMGGITWCMCLHSYFHSHVHLYLGTLFDSLDFGKDNLSNRHRGNSPEMTHSDGISSDEYFERETDDEHNNDSDAMTVASEISSGTATIQHPQVHIDAGTGQIGRNETVKALGEKLYPTLASIASSHVTPTDLDAISNNLQHVYIPNDRDSKRKQVDEDNVSRTRSRSFSSSNPDLLDHKSDDLNGLSQRRLMVIECRSLRTQISAFEEDWMKAHGRMPKGVERGAMLAVYTRYKDMKKLIRDGAATDIQRIIRGFMIRWKYTQLGEGLRRQMQPARQQSRRLMPSSSCPNSSVPPAIPSELYARYRFLIGEKKELKRTLKKFDEDFTATHGQPPKKVDKEVMRPMYQSYHEVKAELNSMRSTIEASHGFVPDEMKEEMDGTEQGEVRRDVDTFVNLSRALSSSGDDQHKTLNTEGQSTTDLKCSSKPSSDQEEKRHSDTDEQSGHVRSMDAVETFESLQEERKNLHAYLKTYERDFNRIHGRPVMRHEDIQPVMNEYERYKNVKAIIRNLR